MRWRFTSPLWTLVYLGLAVPVGTLLFDAFPLPLAIPLDVLVAWEAFSIADFAASVFPWRRR